MPRSLRACNNVADLGRRACRKLPAPIFHYINGAAHDEWSMHHNTQAFNKYELMPSQLRDVSGVDLRAKVLGAELDMPLILAPTGMSRLFHHEKEIAVAKPAEKLGVYYSLSTLATTSIEDIAAASAGPKLFQVYVFKDLGLTRELVRRCRQAGYSALCLTVDSSVGGNRERDLAQGMSVPPRFGLRSLWSYEPKPGWLLNLLRRPDVQLANVASGGGAGKNGAMRLIEYVNRQFDPSVTWEYAAQLASDWSGPFVIKGLQSAEDAKRAVDVGATAVWLSNHGGRQLDATAAPVDCIAPVRRAVGAETEIVVDSGIRRGTHVLKALALGADACAIGRPYLYGLAAGGQRGVERVLRLLCNELERDMALLGCRSIDEVSAERVLFRTD